MENTFDVIILGSGPAGLTAGIYTTRASLNTLIVAGLKWGGQLQLTTDVENFPGFPDGIQGPELMSNMRKQAEKFQPTIVDEDMTEADFSKRPFTIKVGEKTYLGKSVIIATGADTKWLTVPGESERIGRGVSSCAPCDAAFFRNKKVVVAGGGDSAMEEALVLSRFATEVYVIYRGDTLRASQAMQDKVFMNEKIAVIYNTTIEEIKGENKVEKVLLKTKCSDGHIIIKPGDHMTTKTPGEIGGTITSQNDQETMWDFGTDGVFVAIGHTPNTKVFHGIELDEKGYVKTANHFRTNIEGIFTAGDVHDHEYRQAITAAGFGCAAALETERFLMNESE